MGIGGATMTTVTNRNETVTEDTDQDTATTTARGVAGLMAIVGVVGCLTPLAPLGAVVAIIGGVVWAFAPVTELSRAKMVAEVEAGGSGCWPALVTVTLIVAVMALAGLLAIGAGVAVLGGGL